MKTGSEATNIASQAQLTIMVVEDNEGDIELTRLAFEKSDHTMVLLRSADAAMEHLHTANTPDLILLDLNMPGMSGKAFLETIKKDEKFHAIPVILLTSSEASQDIQDCYRLHASGYIVKPGDAAGRADMVRRVMQLFLKT